MAEDTPRDNPGSGQSAYERYWATKSRDSGNKKIRSDMLSLRDDELDRMIAIRAQDQTGRFDYCRTLGGKIAAAREARGMTLLGLGIAAGVPPKYIRLIEAGVLDEDAIYEDNIDALLDILGLI